MAVNASAPRMGTFHEPSSSSSDEKFTLRRFFPQGGAAATEKDGRGLTTDVTCGPTAEEEVNHGGSALPVFSAFSASPRCRIRKTLHRRDAEARDRKEKNDQRPMVIGHYEWFMVAMRDRQWWELSKVGSSRASCWGLSDTNFGRKKLNASAVAFDVSTHGRLIRFSRSCGRAGRAPLESF